MQGFPPPQGTRRRFTQAGLAALVAALLDSRRAHAFGTTSKVTFGLLRTGAADFNSRPEALRRALWETGHRTSIDVGQGPKILSLQSRDLFQYPLLVMAGRESFSPWSEKERQTLRRHLQAGGLLYIDAQEARCGFVDSAAREVRSIMNAELMPLDADHVMFKSFYLLDHAYGRVLDDTTLYGAGDGLEVPNIIMSRCDVLGALERNKLGAWVHECVPGGSTQRERAIRFMVNILMYATCTDYKADQVHIPFIMKKRRR